MLFGNDEQKRRYLPRLATGELIAAFGLTEPGSGSDAASIKTRAVAQPDGSFVLDGSKIWITNGGIADFFTVFAQTEVERDGATQGSHHRVPRRARHGRQVRPRGAQARHQGIVDDALYFDDVRVPAENVLGSVGGGFKVAMGVLNNGRLGLAAGRRRRRQQVMKLALAHATSRRQFGARHRRVRAHQGQDRAHDDGDLRRRVDGLPDHRAHRSRHRGLLGRERRAARSTARRCCGAWSTSRCKSPPASAT